MKVINGSGDIVAMLEETLEHAKKGEVDAIGLIVIEPENGVITGYTWREGAPHCWLRLIAGARMFEKDIMATDEYEG